MSIVVFIGLVIWLIAFIITCLMCIIKNVNDCECVMHCFMGGSVLLAFVIGMTECLYQVYLQTFM